MAGGLIRNISFDLSPSGIDKAIREVNEVHDQLRTAMNLLIQRLVDEGVTMAKTNIIAMGAVYSGDLLGSVYGFYHPGNRIGYVRTDSLYAVFVEFGTGIKGADNSHPVAEDVGWAYDIHNHGEEGWVYIKEPNDKRYWTKGQESRPFMYQTLRWLEGEAERIGADILTREMSRGGSA